MSRRAVLSGLAGVATVAVVGCAGDEDAGGSATDEGPGGADDGGDGPTSAVIAYGEEAELQEGALTVPVTSGPDPLPVVVLVHGGFWRAAYDRSLMDGLATSVVAQGWAAWNIDYRPIGEGGGWPTSFTDAAAGIDHVATMAADRGLDPDRVAVVGHSAGGTFALWSAARAGLPAEVPGADPGVRPVAVVSQAGVTNLAAAAIDGLGQGAASDLMGGQPTGADGDAYLYASPIERVPLGPSARQLLVHGSADGIVPLAQSETYQARATAAGDEARLEVIDGADHFVMIDPDGPAWPPVLDLLRDRFA